MEFFNSAIEVLQTLVVALGAGLGVWGAINLLEGYLGNAVLPEITGGCVCYDKVAFVLLSVGCFCLSFFCCFSPSWTGRVLE